MKLGNTALFIGQLLLCCCLSACDDEQPATPACPECWDEKALCLDGACECPEGAITIEQNVVDIMSNTVPEENTFCVMPDKLTFIARFPRFECFDTFAVTFPLEPLAFNDWPHLPSSPTMTPQIPWHVYIHNIMFLDIENTNEGLDVFIANILPAHGMIRNNQCLEFEEGGQVFIDEPIGGLGADFLGVMVDEDTISGHLRLTGWGTKEEWDAHRIPMDLVRTVPY